MRSIAAAVLAAFALTAAAPAPASIAELPDPLARVAGAQIVLQAGLDREEKNENGLAALVAQTILQTPSQNGLALQDAVAAEGGSISYTVRPRSVRFYVEGTAQSYPQVLALFSAALARPDFSVATVNAARAALLQKIAEDSRLALNVGVQMLQNSLYQGSGAAFPRYGLPETLAGLGAGDARAFYAEHYRRGDAVIGAAGNLPAAGTVAAVVDGLPAGTSPPAVVHAAPLPSSTHQIIARRDVPAPWLVAQYHAPELTSKDFGAMLVLAEFMQRTLSDVSEAPSIASASPQTRGVGAFYDFEAAPANVVVYVDGGLGDPVRTFSVALGVVNVLGHAKLSGDLTQMKRFAAGRLLDGMQTLQQRSLLAAILAEHGIKQDPQQYLLHAVDSATAASMQRVAAKYLSAPVIALVLPRSKQ